MALCCAYPFYSRGVAAGVSSDDANIGFNVGTCILAILSTVQGLLIA